MLDLSSSPSSSSYTNNKNNNYNDNNNSILPSHPSNRYNSTNLTSSFISDSTISSSFFDFSGEQQQVENNYYYCNNPNVSNDNDYTKNNSPSLMMFIEDFNQNVNDQNHQSSSSSLPIELNFILMPYRWSRVITDCALSVYYVTPSGRVLFNQSEVQEYLNCPFNCRCYLSDNVDVDNNFQSLNFNHVFNFDPTVASFQSFNTNLNEQYIQLPKAKMPSNQIDHQQHASKFNQCMLWFASLSVQELTNRIEAVKNYFQVQVVDDLREIYRLRLNSHSWAEAKVISLSDYPPDALNYDQWFYSVDWADMRVTMDGKIYARHLTIDQWRHLAWEFIHSGLNWTEWIWEKLLLSSDENDQQQEFNNNKNNNNVSYENSAIIEKIISDMIDKVDNNFATTTTSTTTTTTNNNNNNNNMISQNNFSQLVKPIILSLTEGEKKDDDYDVDKNKCINFHYLPLTQNTINIGTETSQVQKRPKRKCAEIARMKIASYKHYGNELMSSWIHHDSENKKLDNKLKTKQLQIENRTKKQTQFKNNSNNNINTKLINNNNNHHHYSLRSKSPSSSKRIHEIVHNNHDHLPKQQQQTTNKSIKKKVMIKFKKKGKIIFLN